MKVHFVVNPVAGRRSTTELCDDITAVLRAEGVETTVHVTAAAGDAGRHVAGLAPEACDRLVVVGGDGTLRELVNGAGPSLPWPVGIVPVGTANLVGRELRMPLSLAPRATALALMGASPWTVDALELTRPGQPPALAVANVGIGLDADVVHAIGNARSTAVGSGGYVQWVAPIWKTFCGFRFPQLSVTIDGWRTYRATSCVVQNARNYGGLFQLSPEASLASDHLDVMLLRATSRRALFHLIYNAWRGSVHRMKDVKIVPARTVALRADRPENVQADGDAAGVTNLDVRILPGALTLLRAAELNGDD